MLIQLCYASTRKDHQELLQDLSDILTTAVRFNRLHNINGVLYYAHNSFFQCLEGEKEVVEQLFEGIKKDKRHQDIILLSKKEIPNIQFSDWSMKYVQSNKGVDLFFKAKNYEYFQPTKLNETQIVEFIQHLLDAEEVTLKKVSEDAEVFNSSPKGYKRGYISYI
ncbi:hypothetical protein P256_00937 [Acinetobacter nectaris CIP 110549]|uniref:BLUF domain-containing protein n=1 Tax=Acinetobacter nectaris CIP 110549 TaxID=1392540 RepID=V2UYU6_9GAMM|nr:BLUF domain-containing protein [Acinetobacter nectaris]ESK40484.1 hypothetical protein P256_00937 [Acinetobacter nectaris CIP 110549]